MRIIEIKQTKYGEVAYIFDEDNQRVIKLPVDDFTDLAYAKENRERFVKYDEDAPVRIPRRPSRIQSEEIEPEREEPRPRPNLPDKPKPSIMPPHLRGVLIEPDQPGAAVETRRI